MIRVQRRDAPESFDALVRKPGRQALQELIGNTENKHHRSKRAKVADKLEDVTSRHLNERMEYWTKCLPDLLSSYKRICAYTTLYIAPGTGAPSVDHYIPKSGVLRPCQGPAEDPHKLYEWDNYRLACKDINSIKGENILTVDPFEVQDGWFELEPVTFQIKLTERVPAESKEAIERDINERLKLNEERWCEARRDAAAALLDEAWRLMEGRAEKSPFMAHELRDPEKLKIVVAGFKAEVERG